MATQKTIDPNKFYSLGEIVREGLIPGVDSIPIASRLIRFDQMRNNVLKGMMVKRGLRGVQYKVKGKNIIIYLSLKDEQKDNNGS